MAAARRRFLWALLPCQDDGSIKNQGGKNAVSGYAAIASSLFGVFAIYFTLGTTMSAGLVSLLDSYVAALRASLEHAAAEERNDIFVGLSAAEEMREDLVNGRLGRAFGILNEEQRRIGWGGYYGRGGEQIHEAFRRLVETAAAERLAGRPDAGFGH